MIGSIPYEILPWIGTSAAVIMALLSRVYPLDDRLADLERVEMDMQRYLEAADRVLSNTATPQAIRVALLVVLKAFTSRELMEDFVSYMHDPNDGPGNKIGPVDHMEDGLLHNVAKLQASDPALAEQVQSAVFGLLLCLPTLCGSNGTSRSTERVNAYEGATRPFHMWSRVSAFLSATMPSPSAVLQP